MLTILPIAQLMAQEERGSIPNLILSSDNPGEIVIAWDTPDPEPSDYRVSRAPEGESMASWSEANGPDRSNDHPSGASRSYTLNGLPEGTGYRVSIRARYRTGQYANDR